MCFFSSSHISCRELRRKERLEKDVKELNHSIETNHERYKQKELELAQCLEQNAKTEALLEEEKHAVEKSSKLIDLLNTKVIIALQNTPN